MLKMKCSNCNEIIISALLAEVETVTCKKCHVTIPVEDVLVFSEGFTFHRNDLVKRLFRYKNLLKEVSNERQLLEKNVNASPESKKSLDRFLQALEEVLAGARNNLRLDFSEYIPVKFKYDSYLETGKLANLSMTGACVEIDQKAVSPSKKSSIHLSFTVPGYETSYDLLGTVSWVNRVEKAERQVYAVGIQFADLGKDVLDPLWDFISSSVMSNE